MYKRIVPSLRLDITDFLLHGMAVITRKKLFVCVRLSCSPRFYQYLDAIYLTASDETPLVNFHKSIKIDGSTGTMYLGVVNWPLITFKTHFMVAKLYDINNI